MADELLPQPIGDTSLTPVRLTPEQEELCRRLDELHALNQFQAKPSDMFRGALSVIEDENNPDRIAQAAHSLREILYPIKIGQVRKALEKYGSVFLDVDLGRIYGRLNYLAHHGVTSTKLDFSSVTRTDFDELVEAFETSMQRALIRPIEAHRIIDQFLSDGPPQWSDRLGEATLTVQVQLTIDKEQIYELINRDLDARRYFFHKADERWLDWLWRNGFLDAIKEEAATPFTTRTPELNYLLRMAEKRPDIVVDIILDTPISTDTRSQEVVYGFLRICSALPADQLARVVCKIRTERWIQLIDSIFTQSAFEYEAMLKALADENDFESFLVLAEAVLAVRPREDTEETPRFQDTPFYFNYLSRTKIFGLIAAVGTKFVERALVFTTVKLDEIMAASDQFPLFDVDFFTLELGQDGVWQQDVRELAAAAKVLAVRLIGERCTDSEDVRRIYTEHLASLPENSVIQRLRLFVLSLCTEVFKDEIRQDLFRFLDVERYHNILSGHEYLKTLRKGFFVLPENDRQDFVLRTIANCPHRLDKKYYGSPILSIILPYLDEKPALKYQAEEAGFQLDPSYEPQAIEVWVDGELKTITPQAPISQEEFGRMPVAELANKLRHSWRPSELNARNSETNLDNPLNAEGVSNLLKDDIPERLSVYVENAGLFFERRVLDQHYTYSFLTGIQKAIKDNQAAASEVNWDGVIGLCSTIKDSGEKDPFKGGQRAAGWHDTWLADWDAVHMAMADVLRELLTEQDGLTPVDFGSYRDRILEITGYLLACPYPSPADEQVETSSSGDRADSITDLHHLAINSARGRAFEAFVSFFVQDGKKYRTDAGIEISGDVKWLYERVLQKENRRTLMFLFGHYLPIFYFGDRDWIRKLLPRIFPQEPAKNHPYTAAWGGFLSRNLYEEMFFDPEIQALYMRGLELPDVTDSPQRQRYSEPGPRLAQHLALAFMHYKEFGRGHPLFETFWKRNNSRQHAHFVKFIGLSFISRDKAEESFEYNQEVKSRLREL